MGLIISPQVMRFMKYLSLQGWHIGPLLWCCCRLRDWAPQASVSYSLFSVCIYDVTGLLCRYAPGDPVEQWLHNVLCLDAATHLPRPPAKLPHPSSCELFYVERDTLFSFHKASEAFLQRVGRRDCAASW